MKNHFPELIRGLRLMASNISVRRKPPDRGGFRISPRFSPSPLSRRGLSTVSCEDRRRGGSIRAAPICLRCRVIARQVGGAREEPARQAKGRGVPLRERRRKGPARSSRAPSAQGLIAFACPPGVPAAPARLQRRTAPPRRSARTRGPFRRSSRANNARRSSAPRSLGRRALFGGRAERPRADRPRADRPRAEQTRLRNHGD